MVPTAALGQFGPHSTLRLSGHRGGCQCQDGDSIVVQPTFADPESAVAGVLQPGSLTRDIPHAIT